MTNFIVNPAVSNFNVSVQVEIKDLEKLGWEFSDYHSNAENALRLSYKKAQKYNYNKYIAEIRINGNGTTLVSWVNKETKEDTDWAWTGDNEATISDVEYLLRKGKVAIDPRWDYSLDSNDCYAQSFIEKK
jgi:hypothetical protein